MTNSELSEISIVSYDNFFRLNADYVGQAGTSHFWVGHIFDMSALKSGRSYTYSVHIPSISELKKHPNLSSLSDSFSLMVIKVVHLLLHLVP